MLTCGGRWKDCPSEYGPSTRSYTRWSQRGIWARILAALTEEGWITETAQMAVRGHLDPDRVAIIYAVGEQGADLAEGQAFQLGIWIIPNPQASL